MGSRDVDSHLTRTISSLESYMLFGLDPATSASFREARKQQFEMAEAAVAKLSQDSTHFDLGADSSRLAMLESGIAKLKPLDIADFHIATAAERAFLAALDGSCRTPIAALARIESGRLHFIGEVLTPDGQHRWRRNGDCAGTMAEAMALGAKLGADIRQEAGPLYSAHFGDKGW